MISIFNQKFNSKINIMGCSCTKGTLTNSTRIPKKPEEDDNIDSNQNINEINISEKLNENSKSIPQISSQSSEQILEENKNSVPESIKKEEKNEEVIKSPEKKNLSPREQLRQDPHFVPIEKFDKKAAYYQFLKLNDYLIGKKSISEPFIWFDDNIEQKLIDAVKKADHEAEVMSDFILGKSMFDMHPETMPMYVDALKWGDYKWQLLKRLLLIYQTFKDTMDMETMARVVVAKEQMDKE